MSKPRVVVVGLGSIGKRHIRLLLERLDLDVELCDLNKDFLDAVQKEFGAFQTHVGFEEMLSTKPEVVWLATPTAFHAKQSISALEAGAHVFCEKPMTNSVQDGLKICEYVRKESTIFNVGFHLHFHPAIRRMKEIIESGELGNILHIHARVGTYKTLECSISRHQSHEVGALIWDYAHQPDLIYWITGRMPKSVFAVGFKGGDLKLTSTPNVIAITCEYDISLITTIHLNYVQAPERHEYEIVGDKGWCILDVNSGVSKMGFRDSGKLETENFVVDRDAIYRAEHNAFFDTINGKRDPESSAQDSMNSVLVCQAAIKSWQTGLKTNIKPLV